MKYYPWQGSHFMSYPVTIDNYDVKVHERYAEDQKKLDLTYVKESGHIHPHLESPLAEAAINAKWEELFGTFSHRHPWAQFAPPPMYGRMRNRFFSYILSSAFPWVKVDEEREEEDEEKRREEHQLNQYRKQIKAKKSKSLPMALLEKDRTALLNLLDSIQDLNGLLREINSHKLQYQKG